MKRFREDVLSREELQLVQGTLDVLVLKTLSRGAAHGYAIARWIREATEGELEVEDRALYVSLHRLEARGQLESDWGLSENNRRAKYYSLTRAGRRRLDEELSLWVRYAEAVFKVVKARGAES